MNYFKSKLRILLVGIGISVCLYGALYLLHMNTYVWQSTSLAGYIGSSKRSGCQLTPTWGSNSGSCQKDKKVL